MDILASKVVTFQVMKYWHKLSSVGGSSPKTTLLALHIHRYAKYHSHSEYHMWSGPHRRTGPPATHTASYLHNRTQKVSLLRYGKSPSNFGSSFSLWLTVRFGTIERTGSQGQRAFVIRHPHESGFLSLCGRSEVTRLLFACRAFLTSLVEFEVSLCSPSLRMRPTGLISHDLEGSPPPDF